MSGTRSHSLKAQAIDALIVAHGQPSDPEPAEAALAALTARVQTHCPELRLGSATLANGTNFENRLSTLHADGLVYPLFMANGWFVRSALRKRIGSVPCHVLTPLGLDPALPALAADVLMQALSERGLSAGDTEILVAAHGSAHGQAAAEAAQGFARNLEQHVACARVTTGFVEQSPTLPEIANSIAAPCLCLPFFAMDGDHMKQDVRQGLSEAGFAGDILPAIGLGAGIPQLIAAALQNGLANKEAA